MFTTAIKDESIGYLATIAIEHPFDNKSKIENNISHSNLALHHLKNWTNFWLNFLGRYDLETFLLLYWFKIMQKLMEISKILPSSYSAGQHSFQTQRSVNSKEALTFTSLKFKINFRCHFHSKWSSLSSKKYIATDKVVHEYQIFNCQME